MKKHAAVDDYEIAQTARASYFTACKFLGRGRYDRRRAKTLDEACAIGRTMGGARPSMIYAVTPEGFTIHVRNI